MLREGLLCCESGIDLFRFAWLVDVDWEGIKQFFYTIVALETVEWIKVQFKDLSLQSIGGVEICHLGGNPF